MEKTPSIITMQHLAERLGVSVSTVSLALNESPKVAVATREKVQRLAKKLGYKPDPVLAALNRYRRVRQPQGQRDTLVLLHPKPGPGDPPVRRDWFKPFREGIVEASAGLGYHLLEESLVLHQKDSKQLARRLYHRGVRGLILGPSFKELDQLVFDWEPFSIVATSLTLKKLGFHTICASSRQATELALDQIAQAGYPPSVGFVHTRRGVGRGEERSLGSFLTRQFLHPELFGRIPACLLPEDKQEAMDQLCRWFDRHTPRIVLFGGGTTVLRMVEARGLRVPEDVALVGLEAEKYPELSGAFQPLHQTGIETVAQLHALLTHGETGKPRHRKFIMIDCLWQNTGSL